METNPQKMVSHTSQQDFEKVPDHFPWICSHVLKEFLTKNFIFLCIYYIDCIASITIKICKCFYFFRPSFDEFFLLSQRILKHLRQISLLILSKFKRINRTLFPLKSSENCLNYRLILKAKFGDNP